MLEVVLDLLAGDVRVPRVVHLHVRVAVQTTAWLRGVEVCGVIGLLSDEDEDPMINDFSYRNFTRPTAGWGRIEKLCSLFDCGLLPLVALPPVTFSLTVWMILDMVVCDRDYGAVYGSHHGLYTGSGYGWEPVPMTFTRQPRST